MRCPSVCHFGVPYSRIVHFGPVRNPMLEVKPNSRTKFCCQFVENKASF